MENKEGSIFSLFPNHLSPLGNWKEKDSILEKKYLFEVKEILGTQNISIGQEYLFSIIKTLRTDKNIGNYMIDVSKVFPYKTIKWGYSEDEKKKITIIEEKYQNEHSIFWKIPEFTCKKIKVYAWYEGTNPKSFFESIIVTKEQLDREIFFQEISTTLKKLDKEQVDGLTEILTKKELAYPTLDLRQFAYILATIYIESAYTFQPIQERGGKKYLEEKYDPVLGKDEENRKRAIRYGNLSEGDGVKYSGKGHTQTTWKSNYKFIGDELGKDLVSNPDLLLEHNLSLVVAFEAMIRGWYVRGNKNNPIYKLDDFFNDKKTDWIGARKIINGTNKNSEIADIAKKFYAALTKANIPAYLKQNDKKLDDKLTQEISLLRKP